jgi:hypothetical protein
MEGKNKDEKKYTFTIEKKCSSRQLFGNKVGL